MTNIKGKISNNTIGTNKKNNSANGITLIALVITIIVLLILAAVSVVTLFGEEGLMAKALKSKEETEKAEILEKVKLAVADAKMMQVADSPIYKLTTDKLKTALTSQFGNASDYNLAESTAPGGWTVTVKKYTVTIDGDENILGITGGSSEDSPTFSQKVGSTYTFTFTGSSQEYSIQDTGYYKIECWGASGGKNNFANTLLDNAGTGGYSSGIIYLTKNEKIYVYVGEQGADGVVTANTKTKTSYNGGGAGMGSSDGDDGGGAGGGATDIRLVAGDWDDFYSLKSRIMVAGGGSGGATVSSPCTTKSGGSGGGLEATGSIWKYSNTQVTNHTYNATQTNGFNFGIGQDGITNGKAGGAGAGGGYYGGFSSKDSPAGGAGGGSGYISGYNSCNSISYDSTNDNITHTNSSIHYSEKQFISPVLLDGNSDLVPDKDNENSGNGYAKITFLGNNYVETAEEKKLIPEMSSVSQNGVTVSVSDCTSGNSKITPYSPFDNNSGTFWSTQSGNYGEHWVKIEFEESKIVKKYSYTIGNCWGTQYEFLLQASADGENWKNLETITHNTNSSRTITRKPIFKQHRSL